MKNRLQNLLYGRKTLYLVLAIVMISVFTLSIAYAAMSTVLEIHGNSEVVASSWDIYFANPALKEGSVGGTVPNIGFDNDALYFYTELEKPGDFYEFKIDVVNNGTIDAMIDSVVKTPELTAEQAKYIKYEVSYENGESISTKQTLKKGTSTPIRVRVEYRKDISVSDLPSTATKLDLSLMFVYVQSDGSGSSIPNNGSASVVNVVSGDGTQVGNEVCIGEECFYVISSTDTTVTMLAKYNLHVGNSVDENYIVTPLASPTGIQDEDARGLMMVNGVEIFPFVGTIKYSDLSGELSLEYSGSNAEMYVENYMIELGKIGVSIIDGRIINYSDLEKLGCDVDSNSCSKAPSWVYSTTYWIDYVFEVSAEVGFVLTDSAVWSALPDSDGTFGVRPVITISRDYL